MTDQSTDTTNVQFDEIISIIGVPYKNADVGLLLGAEMTQRQYPPQHGWNSQNLGIWSILHSQKASQQVGECPFQLLQLVQTSSRQLSWVSPSSRHSQVSS